MPHYVVHTAWLLAGMVWGMVAVLLGQQIARGSVRIAEVADDPTAGLDEDEAIVARIEPRFVRRRA